MVRLASTPLLFPMAVVLIAASVAAAQGVAPTNAVLIHLDGAGQLIVEELDQQPSAVGKGPAFLAWAEGPKDHWAFVPEKGKRPTETSRQVSQLPMPSAHFALHAAMHFSLPEIGEMKTFLSPSNGSSLLDPDLVIRRRGKDRDAGLQRLVVLLTRDNQLLLRIPVPAGETRVALADVPDLPRNLKRGLSAGTYVLSLEGGGESTTFTVASDEDRRRILKRLEEIAGFLSRTDPLYLQAAVEHFLSGKDRSKKGCPFVYDALRLLDSVPGDAQTPYLRSLHEDVLRRMSAPSSPARPAADRPDETTGIAGIDQVLQLYTQGRWAEALETLQGLKLDVTPKGGRTGALGVLCRAMILADSGLETEERADALFQQALAVLGTASAADRYRVHNEFATSLLNRVEDRLPNCALQRTAGVPHPLLTALEGWCAARGHYEIALETASDLGPQPRAIVEINLARQYVILADLLRTLDSPAEGDPPVSQLEQAALQVARSLTTQVLQGEPGLQNSAVLKGIAEEIGAHVDLREGNYTACLDGAKRSLQYFLKIGSLAGAESCLRLSGACLFRMARKGDSAAAKAALRDLSLSRCLAELLAERIPAGHTGRLLAGFFDRRADVSGQLIELLLEQGQAAAALEQAEAVRARSLQALLNLQDGKLNKQQAVARSTAELLRNWPGDVVALEYYLGPKRAWVFAVTTAGQVQAHPLCDAAGKPLLSADLIQRVEQFRQEIGFQSVRMQQRLLNGEGFDHAWQDDLFRFYQELLPEPVRRVLMPAKTVVIVPHHVLHYFPFAALVTQRDTEKRGPDEMVKPRFLVDQPFALCYAPSLADWDLLRQRPNRPLERAFALAVPDLPGAPPLPGVRLDVQNLQAAFGAKIASIRMAGEATEGAAWSLLGEPGVALFATHGSNMADRPLESCLYLYPDETNDGHLTAAELYGKSIRSDLVVLSACYSGLADRDPLPGDDLFGLCRAFLQSGARTVVSGLWDVYDGTGPEVTRGLFAGLAAGKQTPQALADAQRGFLAKLRDSKDAEPWLHPYFWAMYTVNGDDRTAVK